MTRRAPGSSLRGRRVLVTGHTGFKGAWASLWLDTLGAEVHGVALEPDAGQRELFDLVSDAGVFWSSHYLDIAETEALAGLVSATGPDVVLHLAAQPIVRRSYLDPVETFRSNVMGTVNVLEAVRRHGSEAVVCVTSDKCYENVEQLWPYRETDPMGGHDPYSASKGCSELVVSSYTRSFASSGQARIASARAGNVIGGGDYSPDRLVPDFFRAVEAGGGLTIRRPSATRPWQHVLESVSGYLVLLDALIEDEEGAVGAWNFGPEPHQVCSVREFLDVLCDAVGDRSPTIDVDEDGPHEAGRLALDVTKARTRLRWSAVLDIAERAAMTAEWYMADPSERLSIMRRQISLVATRLAR